MQPSWRRRFCAILTFTAGLTIAAPGVIGSGLTPAMQLAGSHSGHGGGDTTRHSSHSGGGTSNHSSGHTSGHTTTHTSGGGSYAGSGFSQHTSSSTSSGGGTWSWNGGSSSGTSYTPHWTAPAPATGGATYTTTSYSSTSNSSTSYSSTTTSSYNTSSGGWAPLGTAVVTGYQLLPGTPPGGYPDDFPYGECTYWAALNHLVTWSGNAKDWAYNAARQGWAEEHTPLVGSVVVFGAGYGYSVYGHVAIVVAVGAGRYTISEMNYAGFGVVDQRTITWPDPHVLAFIGGVPGSGSLAAPSPSPRVTQQGGAAPVPAVSQPAVRAATSVSARTPSAHTILSLPSTPATAVRAALAPLSAAYEGGFNSLVLLGGGIGLLLLEGHAPLQAAVFGGTGPSLVGRLRLRTFLPLR